MFKVKLSQVTPNPLQLSIECMPGELHAIVGPSGSGKTTALRTIAGLSNAQTGKIECGGSIWFEANEIQGITTNLSPAQRSCGFLFQQYALFPHLSALENVCIPLYNSVVTLSDRKSLAQEWLDRMGIGNLSNRMPHQLSGGQQQRVAVARAMVTEPKIIFADEPTANLDPNTTEQVEDMIRELSAQGSDVIFSSHQLAQVQRLAQYILFIDQGELKEKGPAGPFFANPQFSAAKRYLLQELVD